MHAPFAFMSTAGLAETAHRHGPCSLVRARSYRGSDGALMLGDNGRARIAGLDRYSCAPKPALCVASAPFGSASTFTGPIRGCIRGRNGRAEVNPYGIAIRQAADWLT